MKCPRPGALRLLTPAPRAGEKSVKPPRPPLGLASWTSTADAAALLLDAHGEDAHVAALVAAQVPLPSALTPGAPLFVLGVAARRGSLAGMFAQVFTRGTMIPRAVRCGALLARGYVDIGAGSDEATGADLVWGFAPPTDEPQR